MLNSSRSSSGVDGIRIERKGPLNGGRRRGVLAGKNRQSERRAKCLRIVLAHVDRLPRQLHTFSNFRIRERSPALDALEEPATADHRGGRCIEWIDGEGPLEEHNRLMHAVLGELL